MRSRGCDELVEEGLDRAPEGSEGGLPGRREGHLAGCEECRVEAALLRAVEEDDGPGAAPPLDDLARRRFVERVLEGAERATALAPAPRAPRPEPARAWWPVPALAGATLGACLTALGFLLAAPHEGGGEPRPAPSAPGPTASLEPARLLLAGAGMLVGGRPAAVADEVPRGAEVATGASRAVIRLAEGRLVSLEPASRFSLAEEGEAVALREGRLLASVTPSPGGDGLAVTTPRGEVRSTGTVFSVEVSEAAVEVAVLRGEVVVRAEGRRPAGVGAGQERRLGEGAGRGLTAEEEERMWAEVRAMDLLDGGRPARLSVASEPAGAEVVVDGVALGETPLAAGLRPGHRLLTLRREGEVVAREGLDLEAGRTLRRSYDLAVARGEAADASPGAARGGEEPTRGSAGPSAQELLQAAQARRAQRDLSGAAEAYRRLLAAHPDSPEARASLVSLGQLELGSLGRPAVALELFDRYLDSDARGALAQEALHGRARALRALGRPTEERAALETFLQRFPSAVQAGAARRRLEELGEGVPRADGSAP